MCAAILNLIQIKNPVPKSRAMQKPAGQRSVTFLGSRIDLSQAGRKRGKSARYNLSEMNQYSGGISPLRQR
jgi:hypothetical protein